jgi:cyclopropane fatty-acyl-phospholipid synthase-like methyltransferase
VTDNRHINKNNSGVEVFDKYARAYQEKFMGFDLYNDTYDELCSLIKKEGARILEIGCGPGNITKYILSKKPDLIVKGIDLSPNMTRLAKENNPNAEFTVMDCRDINTLSERFDSVICGFCMPYLSKEECRQFIKDSYTLLNEKGLLYFSTIEGKYDNSAYEISSNGQDKCFVYYYDEEFLVKELARNQFRVLSLKRKEYPKPNEVSSHIIFIAQKK